MVVFPSIFVADTKIIYGYNFVAPLINSDVSIHHWRFYFLITEGLISVNILNPNFMWDYLRQILYVSRKGNTLHLPPKHSSRRGIISPLFWGILFWNKLATKIKKSLSTEKSKKRLKEHGALLCLYVVSK